MASAAPMASMPDLETKITLLAPISYTIHFAISAPMPLRPPTTRYEASALSSKRGGGLGTACIHEISRGIDRKGGYVP